MMQTGHSLIKARLAETGAPLAGEMSGHIFFADGYYGFDDAVYVAVRLLDILARSEERLGAMIDRLPPVFNTPEIRVECDEARKFAIVEEVKERLRRRGAEFNDIDGVRVSTPDGWWLMRASNTQAVVVVRAEAGSEAGLERLKTSSPPSWRQAVSYCRADQAGKRACHSGAARRAEPGIEAHRPLDYGFRVRRYAAPRNDIVRIATPPPLSAPRRIATGSCSAAANSAGTSPRTRLPGTNASRAAP